MILHSAMAWVLLAMIGCADADSATGQLRTAPGIATAVLEPLTFATCKDVLAWRAANANVFRSSVQLKGWKLELDNRTACCSACMEDPAAALADERFQQRITELGHGTLVVLRAIPANGQEPLDATVVQTSVLELLGGDTVRCAFAHREINPDGVPFHTYLLGFDATPGLRDSYLVFSEKLFGSAAKFDLHPNGFDQYMEAVDRSLKNGRS